MRKYLPINTVIITVLLISVLTSSNLKSQIYNPEGLNVPGNWNDWTNPPTNLVFASSTQTTGGQVSIVTINSQMYQTIISTDQNIGNINGGEYEFKFTSGPIDNIWQNQWGDVFVDIDEIMIYNYGVGGSNEPSHNTISLEDDKWYVLNWDDKGYENASAIFMELSAEPVNINYVTQLPLMPTMDDAVEVSIEISQTKSYEEKVFLRHTYDNWATSIIEEFIFTGSSGIATIPAYENNTAIEYYVFTSTVSDPSANYDLYTIKYDNNNGNNYSYAVGDTLSCGGGLSLIETDPPFPLENSEVVVTFNAELGNGGLAGYNDTVYAHTGVITTESISSSDWKYVKTSWGENTAETKMTLIDSNMYELHIANIRDYYGVPSGEEILQMAFVFRSAEPVFENSYLEGKTADISDIFVDIYQDELNVKITYPSSRSPLVEPNIMLPICVSGLKSDSINLFIDNTFLTNDQGVNLFYALETSNYESGSHWIIANGKNDSGMVTDSVMIFIRGDVPVANLPDGVIPGVNYMNESSVTMVLYDPAKIKEYAFVIGDFNDWSINEKSYMNRTPDGEYYWITIQGLIAGQEYAYQYYVDGELKLADPYCDKVLDPWNDKWIPEENYPNLKPYPFDLTTGIVSVFQTAKLPYDWAINDFTPVAVNETQSNLIIYELLVRDFVSDRRILSVMDSLDYLKSLGINAIELMPINEFEGNDSWGYNPSFYFATDKAYGTTNDYKTFIDACHQKGIAVILDVVLNHSFGQSPLVKMYWDKQSNMPTAQNPYYNQIAKHPLSPGYDFDHGSIYTKEFSKRFFKFWIEEFKVDGFRLDLSKGLTQTWSGQDIGLWSEYDQSRIDILTEYYNFIKQNNPNTYVILEHFANNDEEIVLANSGMLMWGNMGETFNQNTMAYNSDSDYSWAYYNDRGYNYPNLIPYMESHDEQRLMYRNITWGNSTSNYDIRDTTTGLSRICGVLPMYFMVPGPKMIWQFGELGYDYSINYCNNGTVSEDCRTSNKPVRWDYWNNNNRQQIYHVMSAMAKLKTENTAFREGVFSKDISSGLVKRAWLTHNTLNICTGSNFDVTSKTVTPNFQHSGTWYNYFTGEVINVSNSSGHTVNMEAGQYYVFTDQKLERPFVNMTIEVIYGQSGNPVYGAKVNLLQLGIQETKADGLAKYFPNLNNIYTFMVSKDGYDDVTGTIAIGEEDLTYVVELAGADGVSEKTNNIINFYPNPSNGKLTILSDNNYDMKIIDINGKPLMYEKVTKGSNHFDVYNLTSGVYAINLINSDTKLTKKLIIY